MLCGLGTQSLPLTKAGLICWQLTAWKRSRFFLKLSIHLSIYLPPFLSVSKPQCSGTYLSTISASWKLSTHSMATNGIQQAGGLWSPQRRTSKNYQAIAPVCIPDDAASENQPVMIQDVIFSFINQYSCESVQPVIGRLTPHFSWKKKKKEGIRVLTL